MIIYLAWGERAKMFLVDLNLKHTISFFYDKQLKNKDVMKFYVNFKTISKTFQTSPKLSQ